MPKKTENASKADPVEKANKYRDGRWAVPSKRAKGYAEERKAKVHKWGDKEGKELTDYEAGLRSGYLQCQNDHSGVFKYGKLRDAGVPKKEAGELARKPWKTLQKGLEKWKKEMERTMNNQIKVERETYEKNDKTYSYFIK